MNPLLLESSPSFSPTVSYWPDIYQWIGALPDWQQVIAQKILENETNIDALVPEIAEWIKVPKSCPESYLPELGSATSNGCNLQITQIGVVKGVDALNTKKPLAFPENKKLIVVYGKNGSGKSSYTRLLKRMSGKTKADLKTNVFQEAELGSCQVSYLIDGEQIVEDWRVNTDPLLDLNHIDIFDSETGKSYFDKKSVTYKPKEAIFFERLVEIVDKVKKQLEAERDNHLISKMPTVPIDLSNHIDAIRKTNPNIPLWTNENTEALASLNSRLNSNPQTLYDSNLAIKNQLGLLKQELVSALSKTSPENEKRISDLRIAASQKRQVAIEAAASFTDETCLDGIGSETWRELWKVAKSYSTVEAYPISSYPNTETDAQCVLCHQPLTQDAKSRLLRFEEYVTNQLEADAVQSEKEVSDIILDLPKIPDSNQLTTQLSASGFIEATWLSRFQSFWSFIEGRIQIITESKLKNDTVELEDPMALINEIDTRLSALESSLNQSLQDIRSFDNVQITNGIKYLEALKWLNDNRNSIEADNLRIRYLTFIDGLINPINTTAISRKANEISQKVITEAYVNRFDQELSLLSKPRALPIKLALSSARKGEVSYELKFDNTNAIDASPLNILSEGEKRIVELGVFLADIANLKEFETLL